MSSAAAAASHTCIAMTPPAYIYDVSSAAAAASHTYITMTPPAYIYGVSSAAAAASSAALAASAAASFAYRRSISVRVVSIGSGAVTDGGSALMTIVNAIRRYCAWRWLRNWIKRLKPGVRVGLKSGKPPTSFAAFSIFFAEACADASG